ncbi:MAG: outer membrane protein assembly factor BamB family protein [Planctomycetota bacterium]|jgi:outer membrane protein assembly factor BamB
MVRCRVWADGVAWTVITLAVVISTVSVASGENWPRFRGPNGQGLSEAQDIPTKWSEQDYRWRIELPGEGHSSPVVWDDTVFVTCADKESKRGILLCLEADSGRELWRREQGLTEYRLNKLNDYASATPAVDADQLYVFWPSGDVTNLTALTHAGEEVWSLTLGGVHTRHGKGSSPIVHGDFVIVSHEQEERGEGVMSRWLAVDRATGRIAWRVEEPPVANASFSTPCIYGAKGGKAQVVFTSNAHGLTGIDPGTGDVLWKVGSALPARVVSSPVLAGEVILGTCGKGGRGVRLAAVRPGRGGQAAAEVYHLDSRIVPYVPTSVVYQGLLFTFHDNGQISCLKSDTGETVWSEKPAGRFYGSPVCVDGVLYAIATNGDVVVIRASSTYELLGVNALGEKSHSTPAVGDGRMYLRTVSHLTAIGGAGGS